MSIIYPIADDKCLSHVHCVPKNEDISVVSNKDNKLISQKLLMVIGCALTIENLKKLHTKIIILYLL